MKRILLALCIALSAVALAQEEPQAGWTRTEPAVEPALRLFHSDLALNLPTAETIRKGEMQFEVAHRFEEPIQSGHETYYGLDGHANTRLAFGYAFTDRLTATLGRSSAFGNVDLRAKYKFLELKGTMPVMRAVQGGAGWNSNYETPDGGGGFDGEQMQYYAEVVFNTMVGKRLGLGIVPSYVSNSDLFDPSDPDTFAVGGYDQYYIAKSFSALVEMNCPVSGYDRGHDAVAVALELETGGHFFKLMVTNSVFLNPSTYLAGSDFPFADDEWRFGFIITRLLGGAGRD
jgi:hypothetical protein